MFIYAHDNRPPVSTRKNHQTVQLVSKLGPLPLMYLWQLWGSSLILCSVSRDWYRMWFWLSREVPRQQVDRTDVCRCRGHLQARRGRGAAGRSTARVISTPSNTSTQLPVNCAVTRQSFVALAYPVKFSLEPSRLRNPETTLPPQRRPFTCFSSATDPPSAAS